MKTIVKITQKNKEGIKQNLQYITGRMVNGTSFIGSEKDSEKQISVVKGLDSVSSLVITGSAKDFDSVEVLSANADTIVKMALTENKINKKNWVGVIHEHGGFHLHMYAY